MKIGTIVVADNPVMDYSSVPLTFGATYIVLDYSSAPSHVTSTELIKVTAENGQDLWFDKSRFRCAVNTNGED